MLTAILTRKGQITIPVEIRREMRLETGHQVFFTVRADGVVEMRARKVDLLTLCGAIKPEVRGVTVEDMDGVIRQGSAAPTHL